ncbi:MAG: flagellar hook basal-body protein, partial [Myxococcota bacterium]
MSDGFYTAAAGAMAHVHAMDAISNNLANVSTTGFKRQVATFREIQKQADSEMNRQVVVDRIGVDLQAGPMSRTGNTLDVALRDDSFFVVQADGGEQYTRAGSFRLDEGGLLVTADGLPILSDAGPIVVQPGSNLRIDDAGRVLRENDIETNPGDPQIL